MTVRQLWVQNESYNAADDRLLLAAMLPAGKDGPIGSRVGVRTSTDLVLTMTGAQAGAVSAGAASLTLGGSVYLAVVDEPEPVRFGAADSTNARVDVVGLQVYDKEAGGADQAAQIRVVAGQPSQNPVAPATPDGMLVLSEVRYDAGSTAPVLTDRRTPLTGDLEMWAQSASVVVTTTVNGGFSLSFNKPFTAPPVVVFASGDNMGGALIINDAAAYTTTTGTSGTVYTPGNPWPNLPIRLNWIAMDRRVLEGVIDRG